MRRWPDKPFILEINTWVWLTRLSQEYGRTITLADVPDDALDALATPNVDAIWLMGVWQRSAMSRENALRYRHEYIAALPDIADDDIIGSAYSIAAYEVDTRIGGRDGLAHLRERLRQRGLLLILDYVPNHVALDHVWVRERPDFLIQGKPRDLRARPSDFFRARDSAGKSRVLAHGRDPYFPGWSDTAQINAFNPELRQAVAETLLDIAGQCDGLRCDMAMLVTNEVFASTWAGFAAQPPREPFWQPLIGRVREQHPDFLFIAEVYWGKEFDMLMAGFDLAYDKTLYDRVMEGNIATLRAHLVADVEYQKHLLRFIENHDEPRAYDRLGPRGSFPAATLICTLPGACLLHQGQFTGDRVKLPVQIRRGPSEPVDEKLRAYYMALLQETRHPVYQHGQWYLFEMQSAGPYDGSYRQLLAYGWRGDGGEYRLVVVNLTAAAAYGRLPLTFWSELAGQRWVLQDVIDNSTYERDGDEMMVPGLFVKLDACESHIFRFYPAPAK